MSPYMTESITDTVECGRFASCSFPKSQINTSSVSGAYAMKSGHRSFVAVVAAGGWR